MSEIDSDENVSLKHIAAESAIREAVSFAAYMLSYLFIYYATNPIEYRILKMRALLWVKSICHRSAEHHYEQYKQWLDAELHLNTLYNKEKL